MALLAEPAWNLQRIVDLRSLRLFLAVAETGNMTQTATQLGLTQSAVSQSLRQLEQILRVELLDRGRRPLQLTLEGQALVESARWMVREAVQLPERMQGISGKKLPRIRIGLVDSFAATTGPQLIRRLLREAVQISVWTGLSPAQGEALQQRSRDMIITSDPLDEVDGLQRYPIFREPFILLLSAVDSERLKKLDLSELAASVQLIRYSARSHIGGQIDRHLRRMSLEVPRTLEIDTSDTLAAMVAGGIGWAITTPTCLLQGRGNAANLRAVKLPGPSLTRQLVLLARAGEYGDLPGQFRDIAQEIFRNTIIGEIKTLIPWLDYEFITP